MQNCVEDAFEKLTIENDVKFTVTFTRVETHFSNDKVRMLERLVRFHQPNGYTTAGKDSENPS